MTIYYRKIYEQHYGPIPVEENGRSYEIHHLDGDHSNSAPANLIALTLQQHYDIHFSQGDWGACNLMAGRLSISPDEKSKLASLENLKRVALGTHQFLGGDIGRLGGTASAKKQLENGTHVWLTGELPKLIVANQLRNGKHVSQNPRLREQFRQAELEKIKNGTHLFASQEFQSEITKMNRDRLLQGTHPFSPDHNPSQVAWTCEHCGKSGKGVSNYNRWHGVRCKLAT